MVSKKFIQHRERPFQSTRLSSSASSSLKWIFPTNIPSDYDWVPEEVLGAPSKVSLTYLEKLKAAKVVFRPSEERKYEVVVLPTKRDENCWKLRSYCSYAPEALAGNSATEEGYVSTTHSDKDVAQRTSEVIKTGPFPPPSHRRKKQRKGSSHAEFVLGENEALDSFWYVLKEGFKNSKFISSCLMSEETEEFAMEDELTRIQKTLLRLVVLSYDVGREIAKFRSTIIAKDKDVHESSIQIKSYKYLFCGCFTLLVKYSRFFVCYWSSR
ncbi:hypothetical protein PIB30_028537 [Stylosanthes scabra]|uniref:Uncharacterized protein n=1 Tax=Stylosanthes scabra TaxID=79078 RepID=A0ABU6SB75_9FABA|nr:hypothetical protein [Stylosanthes scabra]